MSELKTLPLRDCPPGLFKHGRTLCFKSEYGNNEGRIDAYIVSSGEFFWGGTTKPKDQAALMVTPVKYRAKARLTKAERNVVEAAVKWASDGGRTLQGRADTEPRLVAAVKELRSKKVRK